MLTETIKPTCNRNQDDVKDDDDCIVRVVQNPVVLGKLQEDPFHLLQGLVFHNKMIGTNLKTYKHIFETYPESTVQVFTNNSSPNFPSDLCNPTGHR